MEKELTISNSDLAASAANEATPTVHAIPDFVVPIKAEYRCPAPPISTSRNDVSHPTQFKKRPRDEKVTGDGRLCYPVALGEVCPYGDTCIFNHDVAKFLSEKEPDLGPNCYQYDTYGFCPNGLMCRFGDCHIDRETGANLRRSDTDGGVIPKVTMNTLSKDVQKLLRKKNIKQIVANHVPAKPSAAEATPVPAHDTASGITPYPTKVKLVDFSNKVYIAPLTTLGNLPFRRIMKDFGADITCGEVLHNLISPLTCTDGSYQQLNSRPTEWALLRRHPSEDTFGIQIAGSQSDIMGKFAQVLEYETESDFVDLNCGCPIDMLCNSGCGAALMNRPKKLCEVVQCMTKHLTRSMTVKIRTGWDEKHPTAHKLVPEIQRVARGKVSAVFIHGRSRLQRYSRLADWSYILQVAQAQTDQYAKLPIIGNGDILTYEDWQERQQYIRSESDDSDAMHLTSCAMLGRGALIKPWLPTEIKENRSWDISATERFDILKRFVNYGLDHWGSDLQGVNHTRRFLLEWLSFLHRYVPVGLIEAGQHQTINHRPLSYRGREDLETLLSSANSNDWLHIAKMLLGPLPDGFCFVPKHTANSYAPQVSQPSA